MKPKFDIDQHIAEIENVVSGYVAASPLAASAFAERTNLAALAQHELSHRAARLLEVLTTEALYLISAGEIDVEAMMWHHIAGNKNDSYEPPAPAAALTEIAKNVLHIDTLETRHSDRLDFHELSVWVIAEALTAAYTAGAEWHLPESHSKLLFHPNFNAADLQYLRAKGYTDDEILANWDSAHARGEGPVSWDTSASAAKWRAVVLKR